MTLRGMTKKDLQRLTRPVEGIAADAAKALGRVAILYEGEMALLAPHKTGYLEGNTSTAVEQHGDIARADISFNANYAAQVHELPPAARGEKTRAKPSTKFGSPGPKWVERVLRGMDFMFYMGREVVKILAARARRRR